MKYSANKNFSLPESTDVVDVDDFNKNFEIIDEELKALSDTQDELRTIALPEVNDANNGQFLKVVNGVWAAASIPSAEGASF